MAVDQIHFWCHCCENDVTKMLPFSGLVPSKTLIVVGLTEKTTADELKSAFEGALSARVPEVKPTGVSKRLVAWIHYFTVGYRYLFFTPVF